MTVHEHKFGLTEEIGTDIRLKIQDNTANSYVIIGDRETAYSGGPLFIGCDVNPGVPSNVVIGGQNIDELEQRVTHLEENSRMAIHRNLSQADLHEPKTESVQKIIRDMVPELLNRIEELQSAQLTANLRVCPWCSEDTPVDKVTCLNCDQQLHHPKTWASR